MREVPVEQPINPLDDYRSDERQDQLTRYIRGEFIFPGQRYDSRQVLEAALANVHRATARTPPPALSTAEEIPAWVTESNSDIGWP